MISVFLTRSININVIFVLQKPFSRITEVEIYKFIQIFTNMVTYPTASWNKIDILIFRLLKH